VKYVSDRFKGVAYPDINVPEGGCFDDMATFIGNKNIGEEMDKVIAHLAEANGLQNVIDNAHFNDETKLSRGQEMVDKLSGLVAIFRRPELNFKSNRAEGDDIIGDAYEYLMRNFATESGKSKGQFYTPAEVSRILAKVIGIDHAKKRKTGDDVTVYDPACGSCSLLIRAADEAPFDVAMYGQEKDIATAGLAKMNLVLHNKAAGEIAGNYSTFSDPQYFEGDDEKTTLRRFDFVVANPPFSTKNWTDGLKDYGRFDGYGERPPEKNGDYAWLLHILKSLKRNGKAAVILPHGVLFRGNAEAAIRQSIIDRGYIKGIIGLPANLFYGTGIPASIIVIDKEGATEWDGIFMIDASRDFVKDGNKNRLDVENMGKYWQIFPKLKKALFAPLRKGFYKPVVKKDEARQTIYAYPKFAAYADKVDNAFEKWRERVNASLCGINGKTEVKRLIVILAEAILEEYENVTLIDKYDVYQVLLGFWIEVMADDVYIVKQDGYKAARETEKIIGVYTSGKKKGEDRITGWEGKLIPRKIIVDAFFSDEQKAIDEIGALVLQKQSELEEMIEAAEEDADETENAKIKAKEKQIAEYNKTLKALIAVLEQKTKEQYAKLTDKEILELLVNRKWYHTIYEGIDALYSAISHNIANRVTELTERYKQTLPAIEDEVAEYETKVKSHLERMGFVW
jgi:type I restriction system adenine methylase HsdM